MPLVEVLAEMEWNGIRIDEPFFRALSRKLATQLQRWSRRSTRRRAPVQHQLQPAAPGDPLRAAAAPGAEADQDGASTDASVLEQLAADGHQAPHAADAVPAAGQAAVHLRGGAAAAVNPETGRLHTSFNQTVAATGRLSSSDPNLQNIPIRTEIGAEIRRGFVPPRGASSSRRTTRRSSCGCSPTTPRIPPSSRRSERRGHPPADGGAGLRRR
jgi:DNA polymerase I